MGLNSEQKKFAYGRYEFYDRIQSILDFMDPVSKMDVKIEEVKSSSGAIEFLTLFLLGLAVVLTYIFKIQIADYFKIAPELITSTVIPILIGVFVVFFVVYGFIYWSHISRDVDNDLNNFVIPFLQKVSKYINKETAINLTTDFSPKLSRKNIIPSGTYADYLNLHWFSAQLPFDNNIKVFVDLTYIINCYGKLSRVHSADAFKDLKMKMELRFIFPKKINFQKFEYIGANYILDWQETQNEYSLSVKTVEDCKVEFYREIDRTLGLLFDNDAVIDIIDDIYARITGFTGYLIFNSNINGSLTEEVEDSDYEELENIKENNENFYRGQNNTENQGITNAIAEAKKEISNFSSHKDVNTENQGITDTVAEAKKEISRLNSIADSEPKPQIVTNTVVESPKVKSDLERLLES